MVSKLIMPFDVNNPGRVVIDFFGETGKVSKHDYQKFEKGKDSKIVYMTADKYIDECINNIFNSSYEQTVTNSVDEDVVASYAEDMKKGDIFPLPYLDYVTHNQEGRHRMLAFKMVNGRNAEAPVLIIFKSKVTNEEIEEYVRKKYGNKNVDYWVDYIKSNPKLNVIDDKEDLEIKDNDQEDLEVNDNSDEEDEIKWLSRVSGKSEEELMELDMDEFVKLVNKYA